jgi:hypothetical protein
LRYPSSFPYLCRGGTMATVLVEFRDPNRRLRAVRRAQ